MTSQSTPVLRLKFTRKVCECGERERVLGVPCPSCGTRPLPHEFNYPVMRRQRIARAIRNTEPDRRIIFSTSGVEIFQEVFHDMDQWISRFLAALDANEAGLSEAKELTARLLGLQGSFSEIVRLRPWRGLYHHVDATLLSIKGVWDCALAAYGATSIREAQQEQNNMQRHIDEAALQLSNWADAVQRIGGVARLRPEHQLVDVATSSLELGSHSRQACARLLRDLGSSGALQAGIEQLLVVSIETATIVGEEQEFTELLKYSVGVLRNNRRKSKELLQLELFQLNFARALDEMYRTSGMVHALAITSGSERLAIDGLVNAAHTIVESSTRHPMAVIAAIGDIFGYRSALEKGAAECVKKVRMGVHGRLTDNLDLDVRNAKAHLAYRIDSNNGIDILNDRGNLKRHISMPELIDLVVAGNILAMAMSMAFLIFACEVGIDVSIMVGSYESVPAVQVMQLSFVLLGWPLQDIQISPDQRLIYITGALPITATLKTAKARNLLTTISVARLSPPAAETMIIDDGNASPITLSIAAARLIAQADDAFSNNFVWLQFFNYLRRDSHRMMSDQDWAVLISMLCRSAIEEGGVNGLRKLLKIRNTLKEFGEPDLAGTVTPLIQSLREQITGIRQNPC